MRFIALAFVALTLSACGAPPGFTGEPAGVDPHTLKQGCLQRAWAYKEPQATAVWIDCLADAGYLPDAETLAKREELRRQGY